MDRNLYYIGIAFFGMINGIFNPLMAFAYVFSKVLMAVPLFGSESLFFYFAALMLSTATIILGDHALACRAGEQEIAGQVGPQDTFPDLEREHFGTALHRIAARIVNKDIDSAERLVEMAVDRINVIAGAAVGGATIRG